jgi:hypothetical protein
MGQRDAWGKATPAAKNAELDLQNLKEIEKKKQFVDIENKKKNEEDVVLQKKKLEIEKLFAEDLLSTLGEVEKGMSYFGAAGAIPPLPGEYSKVNWRANYEKLISKNVLDTLRQMKSDSKTGASGFGQLSEKELAVLMNASTVLKRNMSEEDAKRYIEVMKKPLLKIIGKETDNMRSQYNELRKQGLSTTEAKKRLGI